MKKRLDFTIRRRLLLVCSILLIVPILALGGVTYQVSSKETAKQIESGLRNNVRLAAEMTRSLQTAVDNGAMTEEEAQESLRVTLLGTKNADGTRPINPHIDLGENGYFFVLDGKGNLLAHPLLEGQNIWDKKTSSGTYYIQDLIGKAQTGGGFTYYKWPLPNSKNEALKVAYAEKEPTWGWIIAAGSYMKDYDAGKNHILHAMLITLAACLAAGMGALTWFAVSLSRPLVRMADQAERMSRGDLTGTGLKIDRRDEIGKLALAFNHLQSNLKELIGSQLQSANELAESSSTLNRVISDAVEAVNQTSQAINQVAANNESQAAGLGQTSRAMEEIAAGIQQVATISANAHASSVGTLNEAENGSRLIRLSTERIAAVNETVGNLSDVVNQLGERSGQIGEIAGTLQEISAQTNLLALNASIEAARAGDQGKGFAVVAGEIRKLAERSTESAVQVSALIESIRSDIEVAVASMGKGETEAEAGVAAIRETGEAFERILLATRGVVEHAVETSSASEQMSASSQEISAALAEIERNSFGTAGAAQTVAAAAEEQLASMEEISSSARKLAEWSEAMKRMTDRFKV